MPMMSPGDQGRGPRIAPSAALELMWLFHNVQASHVLAGPYESQELLRQAFSAEVGAFWSDGLRGYTEVTALAHRSGTLLDLDLERFFDRLEAAMTGSAPPPTLRSEPEEEREVLIRRLALLAESAELRGRYADLLRRVWGAARPEWERAGRGATVAEGERWKRRTAEGASYHDLFDSRHLWAGRGELDEMADSAEARGALVVSPGWFFGVIHVVELDGTVFIGKGIRAGSDETACREVAVQVSNRMKALADPTRLSILMTLAHRPASVTELAKTFKLSQPTVSGHIQVLRETGLLDERQAGRSAVLSASETGLRSLLAGTQDSLLRWFKD